MAAYRRFVAYVYEYRKDKKGVNCGFVRIEAWRNVCRIELHPSVSGTGFGLRMQCLWICPER